MTTFQDPPPHSRRAARQSERGEGSAPAPHDAVPYAFDAEQQSPPAVPSAPAAPHHSGRRAHLPVQPDPEAEGLGFEPLTYATQGRVSPPVGEQSQQQPLAAAPPPGAPQSAPGQQSAGQSGFRVRDFSPEGSGRRAASPAQALHGQPAPSSPLASPASFPAPTRAVDLDYQTQGVAPAASHSAPAAPAEDATNHTLSRRELRELRAAAEQKAPPLQMPPAGVSEPIDSLLNSGPIDIPTLAPPPGQSQALAEAMAEFDMLTRSRREAEARARDAQVASLATPIIPQQQTVPAVPAPAEPAATAQEAVEAEPVEAEAIEAELIEVEPVGVTPPVPVESVPVSSVPVSSVPVSSVPVASIPAPVFSVPTAPVADAPAEEPPMLLTPAFIEPALPPSPESGPAPQDSDAHGGRSPRASNHWRVQAAKQDDELPYENTLSRTVGSNTSAITTSALVLPSVPQPDSMLGGLTSTGEILVTGSINLPRSLGSTGAHPGRVDNSDFEEDPFDSQVAAPDSAPVRAIRAISSNTSTRGVIETKKPQGNRLLTGVIITASVLCVGLLGLLIFAFATGKL